MFAIPQVDVGHRYYVLSPSGAVNLVFTQGGTATPCSVSAGSVTEIAGGDEGAGALTSDVPVLVVHTTYAGGNGGDVFPVPPAGLELWGSGSTEAWVAALEDDTHVTVYRGDGSQPVDSVLAAGEQLQVATGGAPQGEASVLHLVADKPIGAIQRNDGDGAEATAFVPADLLSRRFALPVATQYAVLTCPSPGTDITVDDGTGPASYPCTPIGAFPGKVYLGSAQQGQTLLPVGTEISATAPIMVTYEPDGSEAEHNLLGTDYSGSAPQLTAIGPQTDDLGSVVNLQVQASDLDGDSLGYSAHGLPPDLSIDSDTGLISGTLTMDGTFPGVIVSVTDGTETASTSFDWTVNWVDLNTAPVVTAPGPIEVEATGPFAVGSYTVTWTATDANGVQSSAVQQVTVVSAGAFLPRAYHVLETKLANSAAPERANLLI